MKTIEIKGVLRTKTGKGEATRIRRTGEVPCILYGGKENILFSSEEKHFKRLLYTPDVYEAELHIENATYKAFVKEAQFHPVTDKLLHVDFIELIEDKPVSINLPVKLQGTAIGVRNGGVLRFTRPRLMVKALPKDLPDSFEIDIENLNIGDAIKIGDLKREGIEFLHSDNDVVVRVKTARAVIEPTSVQEEADLESMTDEERAEYEKTQAEETKETEATSGESSGKEAKETAQQTEG